MYHNDLYFLVSDYKQNPSFRKWSNFSRKMPFKNKNWIIKKARVFSSRNKMDQTIKGQETYFKN